MTRVAENKEKINAAHPIDNYRLPKVPLVRQMKRALKKSQVPKQVKVIPNERETMILEAAMDRFGLKKAQDIISMALTHFADAQKLLKAS